MRYTSSILAVVGLASVAFADDAPVVNGNNIKDTYSATIAQTNVSTSLSGAFKVAAAPDGTGVNIQISLYNLPNNGNLSYGLHTGQVASTSDCSAAGGVLDPYGGITGSKCATDMAACQIGDLSDKYGAIEVATGGSGTGYFAANYVDKYLSMQKGDEAFFGGGSFVVMDASGGAVACANFVNPNKATNATGATTTKAGSHGSSQTGSGSGSQNGGSSSSSTSDSGAMMTAAPIVGAGILGMAALLL